MGKSFITGNMNSGAPSASRVPLDVGDALGVADEHDPLVRLQVHVQQAVADDRGVVGAAAQAADRDL
ncbi:MAG: hypothetical protein MUE49_14705, partial [Rhodospirillales bacterium]|nr:hypothetical protein [Rhodospirillales bacterium]